VETAPRERPTSGPFPAIRVAIQVLAAKVLISAAGAIGYSRARLSCWSAAASPRKSVRSANATMEIPLARAMTSATAVMKVFTAGLRRRLTFTVPALAEIQREAIHTPRRRRSRDSGVCVPTHDQPITIVLDLMNPARPSTGRRRTSVSAISTWAHTDACRGCVARFGAS
jgi:hypothetical protein